MQIFFFFFYVTDVTKNGTMRLSPIWCSVTSHLTRTHSVRLGPSKQLLDYKLVNQQFSKPQLGNQVQNGMLSTYWHFHIISNDVQKLTDTPKYYCSSTLYVQQHPGMQMLQDEKVGKKQEYKLPKSRKKVGIIYKKVGMFKCPT